MRLADLRIQYKLALGFTCILSVFVAASAILCVSIASVGTLERRNDAAQRVLVDVEQAAAALYDEAQTARGYIITRVERHANLYRLATKGFAEKLDKLRADADLSPGLLDATTVETVARTAATWREHVGDPEVDLTRNPATADRAVAIAKDPQSSVYMQAFRDALAEARARSATALKQSQASQARALALAIATEFGAGLVGTLVALFVGVCLNQLIGKPLVAMIGAMTALASGRVDIASPATGRRDEIGLMARAIETFRRAAIEKAALEAETARSRAALEAERLAREKGIIESREHSEHAVAVLSAALEHLARGDLTRRVSVPLQGASDALRVNFNRAAETLRETLVAAREKLRAVQGGAGELTAAVDQLSSRTEQQAANIEETAAALDLITQTVTRTAEGSAHAHAVVSTATVEAREGEAIVKAAITAMNGIETSSRQIGAIVGAIDEIAFQTNLLALNAGVEAARAGEAGRGFAVVASEVRALAQRSAEAAKEIKRLIAASTAEVDRGVDLVARAGTALRRILDEVVKINTVVTEIATGAKDQAVGLREVNTAVSQMDRATQQNAAMVEESTAASRAMVGDTHELVTLIEGFRLDAGNGRTLHARAA